MRYRGMIARLAILFLTVFVLCSPAVAQVAAGSYVLLLDKDGHPLAGSYRIGPGVKMALSAMDANVLLQQQGYVLIP